LLQYVTYSYLLFPLLFLLLKGKLSEKFLVLLAFYGLAFFSLIYFDDQIPKDIKKYYQAFYTFLEYSIFALIFWLNIQKKIYRSFVLIASVLFLGYQLYYVSTTRLQRLDSIPIGIETILVFIYIFCFFFYFTKNSKDAYIYTHYGFWASVGILIYLGGSFFYYILVNHLRESEVVLFGNLSNAAEIIKNILFCISLFVYRKFPISKTDKPKNIPNLDMNII